LQQETLQTLEAIRLEQIVDTFKNTLQQISEGLDIWDKTNEYAMNHRLQVLKCFAAQSSNQKNNERFVKATKYLKRTE